jgi:hypothetical protein
MHESGSLGMSVLVRGHCSCEAPSRLHCSPSQARHTCHLITFAAALLRTTQMLRSESQVRCLAEASSYKFVCTHVMNWPCLHVPCAVQHATHPFAHNEQPRTLHAAAACSTTGIAAAAGVHDEGGERPHAHPGANHPGDLQTSPTTPPHHSVRQNLDVGVPVHQALESVDAAMHSSCGTASIEVHPDRPPPLRAASLSHCIASSAGTPVADARGSDSVPESAAGFSGPTPPPRKPSPPHLAFAAINMPDMHHQKHLNHTGGVPQWAAAATPSPCHRAEGGKQQGRKRVRFLPGEISSVGGTAPPQSMTAAARPQAARSPTPTPPGKKARTCHATPPSPRYACAVSALPTALCATQREASPDELPIALDLVKPSVGEQAPQGPPAITPLPPALLRSPGKSILKRTSSICSPRFSNSYEINGSLSDSMWLEESPRMGDDREGLVKGGTPADMATAQPVAAASGSGKRARRGGKMWSSSQQEGAMNVLLPTAVRRAEAERQAAATAVATGATTSNTASEVAPRAIVFSAFWHHLLLVQQQLMAAEVQFAVRTSSLLHTAASLCP